MAELWSPIKVLDHVVGWAGMSQPEPNRGPTGPGSGRGSSGRESPERREAILEAAHAVLAEQGYAGASMLAIARRAKASKETLYAWFGDKQGLFEALILRNARELETALDEATVSARPGSDTPAPEVKAVLHRFAAALLRLLLSDRALVVNRAAIAEAPRYPILAQLLVSRGRSTVLPKLIAFLEAQKAAGRLQFDDPEDAAETLIGLTLGDLQVRRLLGVQMPLDEGELETRATRAVERFVRVFGAASID